MLRAGGLDVGEATDRVDLNVKEILSVLSDLMHLFDRLALVETISWAVRYSARMTVLLKSHPALWTASATLLRTP